MRLQIAALAVLAACLPPAHAAALDAEIRQALNRGQAWSDASPHPGGGGLIRGAVEIPAPPAVVWRVLLDCETAAMMVANMTRCRVLDGAVARGWDVREHVTDGGLLLPKIRNVFRSEYEPHRRIRFQRVGGDLKVMRGEWRLEPTASGTRVTYENHIAANLPLPVGLLEGPMERDTKKALTILREAVAGRS